ncbi:hypothetical protein TEA_014959 [Camellia sinensis var. sinensis]|uniref:Uncharacterized protein n=1 Tax=Camellia sinensis var. sinensis TaxID=542762 RepID=A0A4S4E8C0_CAMSN|nr:hypothetical protein TEA_014959 [Camellia sinensis var. sinensis]
MCHHKLDGDVAWVSNAEQASRPANRAFSCRCKALMSRIKFSALSSPTTNKDQCVTTNWTETSLGSLTRNKLPDRRIEHFLAATQDERFFDVTHDHINRYFHPNIQGANNHQAVLEYISKYGDYTEWGEFRERGRCANQNNKENIYRDVLAAGSKDEALVMVRNSDPKCYWLNYDKLSSNYDRISFKPPLSYVHRFTETVWIVPTRIQQ